LQLAARIVLLVLLFFSGLVQLGDGLSFRHLYRWVSAAEWSESKALLGDLSPANTRLAVAPHVPHPAALLGFPVAVGYPGHLWSHGFDYQAAEQQLRRLFVEGREAPELAAVTHVLIGPHEVAAYGPNLWPEPPPGWQLLRATDNQRLFQRVPEWDRWAELEKSFPGSE
jgi:hypothetical protein